MSSFEYFRYQGKIFKKKSENPHCIIKNYHIPRIMVYYNENYKIQPTFLSRGRQEKFQGSLLKNQELPNTIIYNI